MKDLIDYRANVYSQCGEDGVISEVLKRLAENIALDKWCVEFGAWNGVYLSNTCRLIREAGYSAVLIEGDKQRVNELRENFPQNNVYKVFRFVNFDGPNTLDNLLSETPIPSDFDFMSIDIDGVDYYIFEGLKRFTPKVICIEFNPSIPNAVDFVQPKDFTIKQGSSAKAISRLAEEKGYSLVASTHANLFFVRNDLAKFVVSPIPTLEELNTDGNDPQYIFVGYDGTLLSNKFELRYPWHGISVPILSMQFLPKYLRVFAGDYGAAMRLLFRLYVLLKMPKKVLYYLIRRFSSAES